MTIFLLKAVALLIILPVVLMVVGFLAMLAVAYFGSIVGTFHRAIESSRHG